MVSLLLVLYLNIAVGTVLAGSDLDHPEACLQGPEFWCKDVATDAKCKKESYCWIYEWSSPLDERLLEEDEGPGPKGKCLKCTRIIQELKKQAGDDPSYDNIDDAIKATCETVNRDQSGDCKSLMKKSRDQIVEALQNGKEPQEICANIKMCKSGLKAPRDVVGSELEPPQACLQGPEFWCKDVATATECQKEEYCSTHQWISLLEGLIDEDTAPAPLIKCALCTKIVQKIKDMVGDDPDEAKIEKMIHRVCNVLNRFLRGTCKNFLRLFKCKLLKYLQKGMGTREICVAIQICKTVPPEVESIEGSW